MCGVIGYQSDNPDASHRKAISALFGANKVRGLHAFGYSTPAQTFRFHRLDALRAHLDGQNWGDILIGHNRYSTSGNWQEHANNQPLDLGGVKLAFNGVIDMRTKAEWEAIYPHKFATENDGEIFIRALLDGADPAEFMRDRGSFAGVWIADGEVYAMRNARRPLWYVCPDIYTTLVASTASVFVQATGLTPTELPADECFTLKQIRNRKPAARTSQQAGRLFGLPHRYDRHRRYGPRIPGDDVSVRPV